MAEKIMQRIDGILRQIERIQTEMDGVSFDEFSQKRLLPEAVSFSLAQIGERMNKLEELLSDRYPTLPWKEARKMRNLIVHDYDHVDFGIVFATVTNDLPALKRDFLKIKEDIQLSIGSSIFTRRLMLRPWNDFDAEELFELAKEPEIGYWCGWKPYEHIRDAFFMLHNFLEVDENYAICLKENGKIIGSIGIYCDTDLARDGRECELAYWIGKPFWYEGYATEAATEITRRAFKDLDKSMIWCGIYEGNDRSKRVLEKLGFVYHHEYIDKKSSSTGMERKVLVNALIKSQWQSHFTKLA